MTITAQIRTIKPSETPAASTRNVRGIDGAVESLAVAMLKWSRARDARYAVNHGENLRHRVQWDAAQQREAEALRLTQRIGL